MDSKHAPIPVDGGRLNCYPETEQVGFFYKLYFCNSMIQDLSYEVIRIQTNWHLWTLLDIDSHWKSTRKAKLIAKIWWPMFPIDFIISKYVCSVH